MAAPVVDFFPVRDFAASHKLVARVALTLGRSVIIAVDRSRRSVSPKQQARYRGIFHGPVYK